MGREIRKVPKDWKHPKNDKGRYKPMFEEVYIDVLNEWWQNHLLWEQRKHPDQEDYPEQIKNCQHYAEWHGNPPDVDRYNLRKWTAAEVTCFQVYETITEGTPVSPVFEHMKDLEHWLVEEQGYSRQAAIEFCKTGFAVTFTAVEKPPAVQVKAATTKGKKKGKGRQL